MMSTYIITYRVRGKEREMRIEATSRYDAKQRFKFRNPDFEYISCREAE